MRQALINRETKETVISANVLFEGIGGFDGTSGIGFFDHMLNSFCVHSDFDIFLSTKGDLHVDSHHTIEDIGIVLGQAFKKALELGGKTGLTRFGNSFIPMDEALAQVTVDISNRPFLVFNVPLNTDRIGTFDVCMVKEFFYAFCMNSGCTLHINLVYGENAHHCVEAVFKAFAHALKQAVAIVDGDKVLSAKGSL